MNIGTALFVNSDPNISAAGSLQGMTNSTVEGASGSLFQQLISRMLAEQTLTAYVSEENVNGGMQGQTGETGDLTELLLAEGNLNGTGLQHAGSGIDGLTAIISEQPEEAGSADGSDGAMSAIQALMGGLVSAAPIWSNSRANLTIQNQSVAAAMKILTAAATDGKDPRFPENLKPVSVGTEYNGILTGAGNLPDGTAGQKTAVPGETGGIEKTAASGVQPEGGGRPARISGSFAALTGIDSSETADSAQEGMRAGLPEMGNRPELRMAEADGGEPAAVLENGIRAEAPAKPDKTAGSTELSDGGQLPQEYQIPLQGTGPAGAAQEQNPVSLTADKAEAYSQIGDEILAKLEQKGPMEFKMQLEPEELGLIDVKLKLSEGKLMIDILAANAKTQALLTSQVDKLISGMGLQNVQVESVQVNQQMNSQSQDSQSQNYSMNAGMDFSQRRQQEQSQGEFHEGAGLNRAFGLQQNESPDNSTAGRIGAVRYDSRRMDYTV